MLRSVCPSLTHKNLNKNWLWEGCCQQCFVECWCCPLSCSGKDKPLETVPWMIIIGFTRLFSAVLPPQVRSCFFYSVEQYVNPTWGCATDGEKHHDFPHAPGPLFPLFLCQERKALLKSVDYLAPWHLDVDFQWVTSGRYYPLVI